MKYVPSRSAIAMIELIFAIVVVAIVMLTIPMIIRVMNQSQELSLGQEIFAKMYAQSQRKSMNPWDEHVSDLIFSGSTDGTILVVPNGGSVDLNCSRPLGTLMYRDNNISSRVCNQNTLLSASSIPAQDGNLSGSKGIEQYNDEDITFIDSDGNSYTGHITVGYVSSDVADRTSVHQTATWTLGNDNVAATGATPAANATHLKRVVMTFTKEGKPTSTFTFFMSNSGVVQ